MAVQPGRMQPGRMQPGRMQPGSGTNRRVSTRKSSWRRRAGCAGRAVASEGVPRAESGERCGEDKAGLASTVAEPPIPVPSSIADVNVKNLLGYASELGEDHPGFHDEEYKARRMEIVQLALDHQLYEVFHHHHEYLDGLAITLGEPIPQVAYTENERQTWATVLDELSALFPKYACREFNESLAKFAFKRDEVPQLADMNAILNESTGFTIRPVGGLLHPRDFLNGLAFRYFHSTQYIRHHGQPMYTPEPDIVHELIGHVPMLADPDYADLVQTIGRASLGASEKMIWHLTKVYWYTVEFGVVREGDDIKGFGAGVLSSFGELEWACEKALDKRPDFEAFNPYMKQPKMSYKDGFQKKYFVLDSFKDGTDKLRNFANDMENGWELS